jgi:hypothetical protein
VFPETRFFLSAGYKNDASEIRESQLGFMTHFSRLEVRKILFFIHLFICAYIAWVISPPYLPPHPSSRQNLFCPYL